MYLAVAIVDAAPEPGDVPRLHASIEASRAPADQVEHVCVERRNDHVIVALYLLGVDVGTIGRTADQLCRRALATWRGARPWCLRSCAVRTIGAVGTG